MNFSEALDNAKAGFPIQRSGWNGKGMHLRVQYPDDHSKMTQPYMYMYTADKQLIPWLCSQADMFAEDWGIAT
jgi:hypothetical protein